MLMTAGLLSVMCASRRVSSQLGVSDFSTMYGLPCLACVLVYIKIRSIAGRSGLALNTPAHLVGIGIACVLFTLTVESISSFGQSQKIGIQDFNRAVTESVL